MQKFTMQNGLAVLVSTLTVFRQNIIAEKLPGIVFPEYVSVNNEGGAGLMSKATVYESGSGDLDDGLVGIQTTSLDTVDMEFNVGEAPIVSWAKSASYTLRELEVAARLGAQVDTMKLRKLRMNADQTLQKVAFIGHAKDKRITGLLNNPKVATKEIAVKKSFQEMTGEELQKVFIQMYKQGLDSTNLIEAPNFIAVPYLDYVELATKKRDSGTDTTVLTYLLDALKAVSGKENFTIKPVPLNYADTAGGTAEAPKKRMISYINEPTHVEFDVPVPPDVLPPEKKGLNAIQVGMVMDFGGVTFHEPDSAIYVDY